MTIRKEGKVSLGDGAFLEKLRMHMRDALIRNIVDNRSRRAFDVVSMLRIPVPREMLESLAGKESVIAAQEAGLVYGAPDPKRRDVLTALGVIRKFEGIQDEFAVPPEVKGPDEIPELADEHRKIADWYERLYRVDHDPRWIRELHYHRLATGDPKLIDQFGVAFRDELFWAGDYWYRELKNFRLALWAFETARRLGLITAHTEMRRASCIMRVGRSGGEDLFDSLILQYPNATHIKTAYVDSLLYLERYQSALAKLREYELTEHDSPWIAHEYGRTYFGLHDYQLAIRAFEIQLKTELDPQPFLYDSLARAYQRQGDQENELRILLMGLRRHSANGRLKLRYASHLIRAGTATSFANAEPILTNLYNAHPTDGRILQQYSKLLCATNRVDEAERIWRTVKDKIVPLDYRTPIHVEILIRKRAWNEALEQLRDVQSNIEHLVGMKKEVYLAWARASIDLEQKKTIAKQGMAVTGDAVLDTNIPYLFTSARLARLAGDENAHAQFAEKLKKINSNLYEILRGDEEPLGYWEDEVFSPYR